jgi:hypothetical protein
VRPIITTVKTHLGKFGRPAKLPGDYGYRVVLEDRTRPPTEQEIQTSREIEDWIQTCGTVDDEAIDFYTRDNFADFLKKSGEDSLILDGAAWELRPGINGVPESWSAVDAGTIFRTKPLNARTRFNPFESAFVQTIDGKIVERFSLNEMAYIIRNKTTDINMLGYGSPELLDISRVILNIMMAYDFNQKFFQQGGPSGLLVGSGNIPNKNFGEMIRQLRYVTSGVANAHRLPAVNVPGESKIEWLNLAGYSNQEMGYYDWILMNMKFVAAAFQIALEETGFYMGREGEGASFVQSNDFEAKIRVSQSKGLANLLDVHEDGINRYILKPHSLWEPHKEWGKFRFEFVGLESKSNSDKADLANKLKDSWTPDEIRAGIWGMKELPDKKGSILLNPIYQTNSQIVDANNAAAEQGGIDGTDGDWNYADPVADTEDVTKSITFDL